MKKYNENELAMVLENHKHWLNKDCDNWEDMCANLRYADLSCADLRYANLRNANLHNADLSGANLSYADLSYADLRNTNLRNTNLRNADLICANLSYADLSYADLRYADLSYADLRYADLRYADLSGANLRNADLSGTKNLFVPIACPTEGSFIGWKKAKYIKSGNTHNKCIVKLLIPEDALRLSATTNKCRCNKAQVLAIQDLQGNPLNVTAHSSYEADFTYNVGEVKEIEDFNTDRWNECSTGIHFFIDKQEALNY